MKKRIFTIILIIILFLFILFYSGSLLYYHIFLNNKGNYIEIPDEIIDKDDESTDTENNTNDLDNFNDNSSQYAELINISKNDHFENKKFVVENLLPGDYITNYYSIRVTYRNKIALRFSANFENENDILSDVLKIKIIIMNSNEILYDGYIKDMEDKIDYIVESNKKITEDYYYEISIYLDASVGNMYQNKSSIIDFEWSVI